MKDKEKENRILIQVKTLYHRYGIKSVTMDDVAAHLCISKKTLYEYFKDKEELVEKVILLEQEKDQAFFRDLQRMNRNAIEELLEAYKQIHTMYMEYNPSMNYDIRKYYPSLYTRIIRLWRSALYDNTLRNLVKGKKEGLYRSDLNTRIIAKLHVIRIETMFDHDLLTMEEVTSFKVFHEIFTHHLYGIVSKKGLDFLEKNFTRLRAGLT
jgi:TetR/AcrR family transcriptional regulator, cholesterol catabolism regulator